jgi:hypothetical protein
MTVLLVEGGSDGVLEHSRTKAGGLDRSTDRKKKLRRDPVLVVLLMTAIKQRQVFFLVYILLLSLSEEPRRPRYRFTTECFSMVGWLSWL